MSQPVHNKPPEEASAPVSLQLLVSAYAHRQDARLYDLVSGWLRDMGDRIAPERLAPSRLRFLTGLLRQGVTAGDTQEALDVARAQLTDYRKTLEKREKHKREAGKVEEPDPALVITQHLISFLGDDASRSTGDALEAPIYTMSAETREDIKRAYSGGQISPTHEAWMRNRLAYETGARLLSMLELLVTTTRQRAEIEATGGTLWPESAV